MEIKFKLQECLALLEKEMSGKAVRLTDKLNKRCGANLSHTTAVAHLKSMCIEGIEFCATDTAKALRWLGFVEGAIWSIGWRSIEELKI